MKNLFYGFVEKNSWPARSVTLGVALIAGLAASGTTQALTVVQTKTLNFNQGASIPPVGVDTSFNGFNVVGATLTGVSLAWNMALNLDLFAEGCNTEQDCEASLMDWSFSGKPVGGGAFGTGTFAQTTSDYGFNNTTDDIQQTTSSLSLSGSTSSFASVNAFNGAGIIGQVENFWQSLATNQNPASLDFGSLTNTYYQIITTQALTGNIILTYTYTEPGTQPPTPTAAPTPTTLALLGLGLAGIGFQRQRKVVR